MKDYKKILECVVDIINNTEKSDIGFTNICTYIGENCPELKESEDEKIRVELLNAFQESEDSLYMVLTPHRRESFITWLKKQGEQSQYWKPSEEQLEALDYAYNSCPDTERGNYYEGVLETIIEDLHKLSEKQGEEKPDKVEPKFHEGDWIITPKNKVLQITSIEGTSYRFNNESHYWEIRYCDEQCRLWTLQEARDGDVLASEDKDKVFLYNGKLDLRGRVCAYCGIYKTYDGLRFTKYAVGNYFTYKEPYPATKEQRDTLEKAMTDAGYRWNSNEKKLEKIEQKHIPKHKIGDTVYYDSFGRLVSFVIANIVEDGTDNPMYEDKEGNAIFEKDLIEQKPAWSEEDEYYYGIVQYILNNECVGKADRENAITWYNFLKDRVQPQPKQEWSEEDERMIKVLNSIIRYIIEIVDKDALERFGTNREELFSWLKSLSYKIGSQKHWKPSDKQMKTLNKVIFCTYNANNIEDKKHIESLYNNLKKLTE